MAKVFNFPVDIKNIQYHEQPFSLYQLMDGDLDEENRRFDEGDCYVTGIRFIQNGVPEFNELIKSQRGRLQRLNFDVEQINGMLEKIKKKDRITVNTKFAAMAHPVTWDEGTKSYSHLDGCPYRAFITNFERLAIIHPEEKRIDIVPYDEENRHRSLFYDIKAAKMASVRWTYDGTMEDTLREFAETHTFNVSRNYENSEEYFKLREKYGKDYSWDFFVTEEDVPLNRALELVSGVV